MIKGDLGKEQDLKKIIKFSKNKLKYFDCLINNASLFENDKIRKKIDKTIDNYSVSKALYDYVKREQSAS